MYFSDRYSLDWIVRILVEEYRIVYVLGSLVLRHLNRHRTWRIEHHDSNN